MHTVNQQLKCCGLNRWIFQEFSQICEFSAACQILPIYPIFQTPPSYVHAEMPCNVGIMD